MATVYPTDRLLADPNSLSFGKRLPQYCDLKPCSGKMAGVRVQMKFMCAFSVCVAVTNALSHEADIAKVQEWFGHANTLLFLFHWKNRRPKMPQQDGR